MKANVNRKYAYDAMDIMEQVAAGQMLLSLHDHFGWGADRLNRLRRLAEEDMRARQNRLKNETGFRGLKYSKSDLLVPLLERDLKDIGVDRQDGLDKILIESLDKNGVAHASEINGRLEKIGVADE